MWVLTGYFVDSITGETHTIKTVKFKTCKEGRMCIEGDLWVLGIEGAKEVRRSYLCHGEEDLYAIRYNFVVPPSDPMRRILDELVVTLTRENEEDEYMDKNLSLELDLYTNNAVDTNETYPNEVYNVTFNENRDYDFKYISGFEDGEEAGKRDAMALFKTVAGIDSEEVSTIDALNGAIGIFSLIQAEMEEAPDEDMDLAYELLRNIVDIFDAADTANADLGNRAKCLAFVEGLINFMTLTRDATEELETQKQKEEGGNESDGEA